MLDVIIESSAQRDIEDIANWYDEQRDELGDEFLEVFFDTLRTISQFPEIYQERGLSHRTALMKRFPYSIYYSSFGKRIYVFACLHQARDVKKAFESR